MKKKIVSFLLASAMTVVSLAGCGTAAGQPAAPAADNAPAQETADASESAAEAVEDSASDRRAGARKPPVVSEANV